MDVHDPAARQRARELLDSYDWADASAEDLAALTGATVRDVAATGEDAVVVFADGRALRAFSRRPGEGDIDLLLGTPRTR